MFLDNTAKKIERMLVVGYRKMVSPQSVGDTIYGTLIALVLLFCLLYLYESLVR